MSKMARRYKLSLSLAFAALFSTCAVGWYLSGPMSEKVSAENFPKLHDRSRPARKEEIRDENFESLITKAEEKGRVLVIVGLRTEFVPVGHLTKERAADQQNRIRDAQASFLGRFSSFTIDSVKQFDYIPFIAAEVDLAALRQMARDEQITSIQEDTAVKAAIEQSLPLIQAPPVWAAGFEGLDRAVAILDTGVDKSHPFFGGRVVSEGCYSTNYPPHSATSLCPGAVTSSTVTGSGLHCTGVGYCSHGTHVAGIAAGNSGVAKKSQIVAIQVFSRISSEAECSPGTAPCVKSYTSDNLKGLERVQTLRAPATGTPLKIDAVNMSLTDQQRYTSNCDLEEPALKAVIDNLRSLSVATVVASGNDYYTDGISNPACISSAISVGSTLDIAPFGVSTFSNSAPFLKLLAPGSSITSVTPGANTETMSGTSQAAPHVAGGFALLKSAFPQATVNQVLDAMVSTGVPIIDERNGLTKPRIALQQAYVGLNTKCAPDLNSYSQNFPAGGGSNPGVSVSAPPSCAWMTGTVGFADELSVRSSNSSTLISSLAPSVAAAAITSDLAVSNFTGTNVGPIPDGPGPVQTPGAPRDVQFAVVGMSGRPGNVELSMTVNHTWVGDLRATLIAPNGTSFTVFGYTGATGASPNGYGSDLNGTYNFKNTASGPNWWTNAAFNPVPVGDYRTTVSGPTTIPAAVTNLTAAFAGVTNPNGTWILRITDGQQIDTGSISAATLSLSNAASWINVFPTGGTGNGSFNYAVDINSSSGPRTGTIRITGANGTVDHNVTQAGSQIISTRVRTFPAGRTVTVDGVPQTFDTTYFWAAGTTHTIGAADQAGPTGTNYRFSNWGQGGPALQTIAPLTDGGINAYFTTQYLLTRAVVPAGGGTVGSTPLQLNGFYDAGSTVQMTAVPNPGFVFSGWSGDLSGTASPQPLVMSAPRSVTANFTASSLVRRPFDFDGDGKTDISIFRPAGVSGSEWWYLKSTGGSSALQFGASSDKIAATDFTGDGKTDVAFWRPSTGQWFVLRSENLTFFAFPFGATGDIPVPADFDGDGKADAAVFRPTNATWYVSRSSGGTDFIGFGATTDRPVPADYDGDGKADAAIFRPAGATGSEWWIRRSSNTSVFALQFGIPTDKTVVGDYTGDGKADIAFWRPSNGNWFVLRSEDSSFFAFPFGISTDLPTPGDYDGDGRTDAGVFRPSSATWYIQRSTAGQQIQQFGSATDLPLPNAFVR